MSDQSSAVQMPAAPAQPQQLAPVPAKAPISFGRQGVELSTLEDAYRFSNAVVASGFAPRGMEKPESVLVAIQLGLELGLTPMAAMQNIGVINGRPGIYGDAALALVRSSGLLESYEQKYTGEGDKFVCSVTVKRKGDPVAIVSEFGVQDAKSAGLWGKAGPWSQYPRRMLLFRARGFALRDAFGDVLKGLRTSEELADMPEINVTPGGGIREAKVPVAPATVLDLNTPAAHAESSAAGHVAEARDAISTTETQIEPAKSAPEAEQLSPAEHLVKLAADAGIAFEDIEGWAKARRLNPAKDSDAQRIVNAWATVSATLKAGGAA